MPRASTGSTDPTDASDRAEYLDFARTWADAARAAPIPAEEVERRVVRFFRQLVRRLEPAVVLEIGAHGAQFSRWAARQLPEARVTAFEANPYVHAKFADRLAGTRVDYRHLAVGPVTGEIQLIVPTEVRGQKRELTSRMASLGVHTKASGQVEVTVPSVRLADFLTLADGERLVAWIDVEGANGPVLESSAAVLDRLDAAYVEVELEETWEGQWLDADVAAFLKGYGLVPVARDVKRPHQYNVVFVRDRLVDEGLARRAADLLRAPGPDDEVPQA